MISLLAGGGGHELTQSCMESTKDPRKNPLVGKVYGENTKSYKKNKKMQAMCVWKAQNLTTNLRVSYV